MEWASPFLRAEIMPFVVAIAGILLAVTAVLVGGILKVVRMLIIHRERMAKIAHGIDPDYLSPPADAGPP